MDPDALTAPRAGRSCPETRCNSGGVRRSGSGPGTLAAAHRHTADEDRRLPEARIRLPHDVVKQTADLLAVGRERVSLAGGNGLGRHLDQTGSVGPLNVDETRARAGAESAEGKPRAVP